MTLLRPSGRAHQLAGMAEDALHAIATMVESAKREASRSLPSGTYALVRLRMAHLLGVDDGWHPVIGDVRLEKLADWPTSPAFSATDRAILSVAEQFQLDVAGSTDQQRADLHDALGEDAEALLEVLYAVDAELRLCAATRQLFGEDPVADVAPDLGVGLTDALNLVTTEISRLDTLDPLTTELVRLRGARLHHCRLCESLRHADALAAGGTEDFFAQVDDYETAGFSDRHTVALRLADAILARPGDFPDGLADQVHAEFAPTEALEIVLDVVRNARNKIAVARGTDGDGVGEQVRVFATPGGRFELR
ncbi:MULTISPECIES: carboxymuconolactone decarboxylase family protein [unclassified Nocardioides]|uniref:carboxymuconolactone decarboxylase family protein n=1 Tax=unclassified Nocardioides TaxID=2615069 RepID=UPI0006F329A4|nr:MULTISPECIES: hypothetical protein [unclassified Nocardioides]KQY54312.1 hypothetical protein ASD30_19080 [Nocardioides sp. Root140]KQZ74933.1 hypothetical protein ASD66_00670 [Nocardioides sp. Root151]